MYMSLQILGCIASGPGDLDIFNLGNLSDTSSNVQFHHVSKF